MKKLNLALMLLGLSSASAFAGGIDYQEPEESGVFIMGIEALYVQPTGSDFVYGIQNNSTVQIDPSYDWGYHVDLGYAMPGNGPDFNLGYTHLSSEESENRADISAATFGPILNGYNSTNPLDAPNFGDADGAARAKTEYDYTDIDLLIGKEFVLQNRYHFHPFAGVRYADIESKDSAIYTVSGEILGSGEIKNEFDGIGPRAGIDAAMEITKGFSFTARAAGSLLIGNYDYKATVNNVGNVGTAASATLKNSSENITVPEIDYRLGLNYTHEFSSETSLGVELGWTTVKYIDVMDRSIARSANTSGSMSDWGFQGPYLRLQANIA